MRVIEGVVVQSDLDPWLSLEALAVPPRPRRGRKGSRRALALPHGIGYSGLSRRTLQDLISAPKDPLPSYRVGANVLIRKFEFDAWMARRRNMRADAPARLAEADARALLRARPRK